MSGALDAVLRAVADLNRQLAPAERLPLAADTALVGPAGRLDSLGVVNLVVATEQYVAESLGRTVVLTDDRTLADAETHLATVGSFAAHVERLLQETGDAGAA